MTKKNIVIDGPITPMKKIKLRCLSILPTLTILSVIAFFYITYMATFLMPRLYVRTSNYDYDIIKLHLYTLDISSYETYFIILHYLLFWFVISMVITMSTKHADVPKADSDLKLQEYHKEYQEEKRRNHASSGLFDNLIRDDIVNVIETAIRDDQFKKFMKSNGYRFCEFCNIVKPKRAHHCRQCGKCIMKMDHHCNWLYNCIGYSNYKSFLVFLFYTDFLLIFMLMTYLEALAEAYESPEIQDLGFFIRSFCFFLNATFMGICFIFTGFHVFYLLCYGKTTLEYCEKKCDKDEVFDKGCKVNFVEIFGCNPLFWLIPVDTTQKFTSEALYEFKANTDPFCEPEKQEFNFFKNDDTIDITEKSKEITYISDSQVEIMAENSNLKQKNRSNKSISLE